MPDRRHNSRRKKNSRSAIGGGGGGVAGNERGHERNENEDADDDDEEIDEDEAFDSDDERKYGAFFENRDQSRGDGSDDSDGAGSESDDDAGSASGSDEGSGGDDESDDDAPSGGGEEEEEEESSSEASSSSDDEDGGSGDDDEVSEEDDGDDGQYMLDLLDRIEDGAAATTASSLKGRKPLASSLASSAAGIAAHTKESEFSASVLSRGGGDGSGGVGSDGSGAARLTLDDLMRGLEGTPGFGTLQKQLKKVATGTPTAPPVSNVVSERAKRKVHYEDQAREVSAWIHAVQENRKAETLDFRPKHRVEVTKDVMVDSFVPTTSFEKAIHAALQDAGQHDEDALLQAEQQAMDDLGANNITLEEYKIRRGRLAKMRALMLYRERKNHQMKKIKSKTYRRIRKRQRERAKEAEVEARAQGGDDALIRELEEKEEMERMKERMTLAHKNTSKWAKRVLKRGKNVDVDTRRALSAQLKRGDDLLQRMNRTRASANGDSDYDSDEDLVEAARKVLAETEDDKAGEEPTGLFKLAFMQKGIERQRQQARDEAKELLRELEEQDDGAAIEAGASDGDDDLGLGKAKGPAAKPKVAPKEEMKKLLGKDELVASKLKFGNSDQVAVSGDIQIDVGEDSVVPTAPVVATELRSTGAAVSTHTSSLEVVENDAEKAGNKRSRRKRKKSEPPPATTTADDANPWLPSANESGQPEKKAKPGARGVSAMINVERAIDLLDSSQGTGTAATVSSSLTTPVAAAGVASNQNIATLTQEELVRKAFATVDDKEVDDEFEKEKRAVAEEEDPTNKERNKKPRGNVGVDGWGSWAGKGALPALPPRRLPKKLQPPDKKLPPMKRTDDKRPHVIVSQKRLKRLADAHMIAEVPYPFSSREEYERSMAGGLGREWNVTSSFKDMTRPEIMTRAGKIIQPISIKVKQKRPAAKF